MSEKTPKKRDLAVDLFRSYKTGFTKKKKIIEERSQTPGDPTLIASVLNELIAQRDWNSGLAEGTLFATWPQVVGPEIASHTTHFLCSMAASWSNAHPPPGQLNSTWLAQLCSKPSNPQPPAPLLNPWTSSAPKHHPGNAAYARSPTAEAPATPTVKS